MRNVCRACCRARQQANRSLAAATAATHPLVHAHVPRRHFASKTSKQKKRDAADAANDEAIAQVEAFRDTISGTGGGASAGGHYDWWLNVQRTGRLPLRARDPVDPLDVFPDVWGADAADLPPGARPRAFFDVSIDGAPQPRVVFELAADLLPRTCARFLELCAGDGKAGYAGTALHHVRKGVGAAGGADASEEDGAPLAPLDDELYFVRHDAPGVLATFAPGAHSAEGAFLVTTEAAPQLNGRSVAFGRVVEGMTTWHAVERVPTTNFVPQQSVEITACGVVVEPEAAEE